VTTRTVEVQENKRQSAANTVSDKQHDNEPAFLPIGIGIVDNRPEAIVQRKVQLKLQKMANNSPKEKQIAQLQAVASHHSAQKLQPIQNKENNTDLTDLLKKEIGTSPGISSDHANVPFNSVKPVQLMAHAPAQDNVIQMVRFIVHPVPQMGKQTGLDVPSQIVPVVDLNCGWYSLISAIDHFRKKGELRDELENIKENPGYDKTKKGYNPGEAVSKLGASTREIPTPKKIDEWRDALDKYGPLIISGQIGEMNVQVFRDIARFFGVGHYILVIGADTDKQTLIYKDALVGDEVKEVPLAEMKKGLDKEEPVFCIAGASLKIPSNKKK
jgi:hypothetical protein